MSEGSAEQDAFEKRLARQIEAYHDAALLYAAVKLGLPDRMGERAWSAGELADALALSPEPLGRFLRGLVTLGLCTELPDGTFTLTGAGRSLASGSPSRLREKVLIVVEQYWQAWANLMHSVRTGDPSFEQVFGLDVRDWRRVNAEQGAVFESYLAAETVTRAGVVAEAVDFSGVETVADIGGGYGGPLAAVLAVHPRPNGILFDRPHIVDGADGFLQSRGVAERVRRVGGDMLAAIPVQADLYLLNGVLRQWDDAACIAILRNCRDAMSKGTRLVISERPLPERASDDAAAIMLDLHMMAITGGRLRRLAEIEALLASSGFSPPKVTTTRAGLTIIEAEPVSTPG